MPFLFISSRYLPRVSCRCDQTTLQFSRFLYCFFNLVLIFLSWGISFPILSANELVPTSLIRECGTTFWDWRVSESPDWSCLNSLRTRSFFWPRGAEGYRPFSGTGLSLLLPILTSTFDCCKQSFLRKSTQWEFRINPITTHSSVRHEIFWSAPTVP
jgi:hypothetical protein